MFTALLTFLGGATVRLALGHLFEALTKWQDQKAELERLRLQKEIDDAQHARQMESIRLQADMGVKVIEAQTVAHVTQADADAFIEAVKATGTRTGVALIDAWNGSIRPALATLCIVLWGAKIVGAGFVLDEWDRELVGLALGVFVGGRIHATSR